MFLKLFQSIIGRNNVVDKITNYQQIREKFFYKTPRKRNPVWFIRKDLKRCDEHVTKENTEFVKEVIKDQYGQLDALGKEVISPKYLSPLKGEMVKKTEWNPSSARCGLIARKIGSYPLWTKNGRRVMTTLLQILDNQVVKHYAADEYNPARKRPQLIKNKKECLLIGAEGSDPTRLTKEYCGLFSEAGIMPKGQLARFFVTPECVLPLGTCLNVMHFRVGDYVDIRGKTIDRGFQGVMKRWGFKGMPATHGTTRTHRRPGNIGGGGEKGRVWPGKKLPGHMGNRYRLQKGLKVLRISPKYNVMWVKGQAIPGETNSVCYVMDCVMIHKKPQNPHCPTYIADDDEIVDLEKDLFSEEVHNFSDPTIAYKIEVVKKKR